MKTLIAALIFSTAVQAQTTPYLDPEPVNGISIPVTILLDGPGTITWNTAAVAITPAPWTVGDCTIDTKNVGYPGNNIIKVGFTCTGPGYAFFTTTGQLTTTCPYDGGTLQGLRLTLALDGEVFYNEELNPQTTPITCYLTPPSPALVSFTNGILLFNNTLNARASAYSSYVTSDPAWTYAQHTFTVPTGVTCQARRHKKNNWSYVYITDPGFICSTQSVPAGAVLQVTVQ